MAQAQILLSVLKSALKGKGFTYKHLSERLQISEVSLKRLFTGRVPMTLDRLEQICDLLGIDFLDLAKMAGGRGEDGPEHLTLEQEQALATDEKLFICFYSIIKGLPTELIANRFRIRRTDIQKYLLKLDSLKLIELHPGNRIKLIVPRYIKWMEKGPLSEKYESEMRSDFVDSEFKEDSEIFRFVTAPLSKKSRDIVIRKIRLLAKEVNDLSEVDCALDKKLDQTSTMLIGFREWVPKIFRQYLQG